MSIPAGSIITMGGLNVVDRLQDAGLQNPKIPMETVRETGNNLVVGKVLQEPDFTFKMTSWDTNCDMIALLEGKTGSITEGPSAKDAAGTKYRWENVEFINICSPWKRDTGSQGGHIEAGVIVPSLFPKSLTYKFGVKENASQEVTLSTGSYFMDENYPIEETAAGNGATLIFESKEAANVYKVGGHGGTDSQYVFGVLVDGVIQIRNQDYTEEQVAETKKAKITFAKAPANLAVIKFCYFSTVAHQLEQSVAEATSVSPAAVRGRDIEILLGPKGSTKVIRGVQQLTLNATWSGEIQREMGNQEIVGDTQTGTDVNGTIQLQPKEIKALYVAMEEMLGVPISEIVGSINQYPVPLTIAIYNPTKRAEVLKSIYISDALFQPPGETVKVNTATEFPINWESEFGTFEEIKGQLP